MNLGSSGKNLKDGEDTKNYGMPSIIPIHAHWDITYGCNFKCVFCLSSAGHCHPDELTTEEGKNLIDKLYDAGIVFLKVLGGEPFFRKDTIDLFKYAANKGMILSFSTNASMITSEIAESLFEIRKSIIYLQISLYGNDENTYKQVTGSTKNFDRALNGLKLLKDKGFDITILVVATEYNSHKIREYYNIARKMGVKEFRIAPKITIGRAAKDTEEGYHESKVWAALIPELRHIKTTIKKDDPVILIDARPLFGSYLYDMIGIPYFWENCNSATRMIYIDPMGKAAPCPFLNDMPERLKKIYGHIDKGDILHNTFYDIWNSEVFQRFRGYYDPAKNLFKINTKCKFYKNGTCNPCIITPCNCISSINALKNQLKNPP